MVWERSSKLWWSRDYMMVTWLCALVWITVFEPIKWSTYCVFFVDWLTLDVRLYNNQGSIWDSVSDLRINLWPNNSWSFFTTYVISTLRGIFSTAVLVICHIISAYESHAPMGVLQTLLSWNEDVLTPGPPCITKNELESILHARK